MKDCKRHGGIVLPPTPPAAHVHDNGRTRGLPEDESQPYLWSRTHQIASPIVPCFVCSGPVGAKAGEMIAVRRREGRQYGRSFGTFVKKSWLVPSELVSQDTTERTILTDV